MMGGDPLGQALLIIAPLGLAGIFVVTLLERLVPLLPSQGIFAAIGVAAANGLWCLPTAMLASVIGGSAGAFATYSLGVSVAARDGGTGRIQRVLHRRDPAGRYLRKIRRSSTSVPFTAQLIPGARLLAPMVAGTMVHDRRRLAMSVLAGLAVWNMTFMSLGFLIVRLTGSSNTTLITLGSGLLLGAALLSRPLAARSLDVVRSVARQHPTFSRQSFRSADRSLER
ncbi:DedA family protein [Sphingomonas sp. DT-51]|uniref:DedA family protein n=1 Tax=Sphingomonas sp. DT-51 TaxID=3396165 RepID=UPI003F1DBEFB